ncbi:hypothetical protein OIU74_011938 [Salix koriyanagi]|uniref:Uncharacterized protein n=1 Tax=Salix koriyanagi TaxID=2511006 RepID=A0A9Q0Q5V5_9ROSI|nr:hypothetical protein OIU74_011938 [Salix koriyanagi]
MIMSSSLDLWGLTSYAFEILAFVRGERDEDSFSVLLRIPGKLIRYDFKDKSSTKLCGFNPTVYQGIGTGPENESKFVAAIGSDTSSTETAFTKLDEQCSGPPTAEEVAHHTNQSSEATRHHSTPLFPVQGKQAGELPMNLFRHNCRGSGTSTTLLLFDNGAFLVSIYASTKQCRGPYQIRGHVLLVLSGNKAVPESDKANHQFHKSCLMAGMSKTLLRVRIPASNFLRH